jgi:sec-independent protein translocase protein TatB
MFGVDSGELFVIVLIAVVVIGPKDLPRVMRQVGQWVGKARAMASQFRLGVDQMMKDSEIADLERKWREQNEAIMKAHPMHLMSDDAATGEKGSVALDKPPAPFGLDKPAPAEDDELAPPPSLAKSLRPTPAPPVTNAKVVTPRGSAPALAGNAPPPPRAALDKPPAPPRRPPRLAPDKAAP